MTRGGERNMRRKAAGAKKARQYSPDERTVVPVARALCIQEAYSKRKHTVTVFTLRSTLLLP